MKNVHLLDLGEKEQINLPAYAEIVVPGNHQAALEYAVEHWITLFQEAIQDHGFFAVALSGGSTPKALYRLLSSSPYKEEIQWEQIYLFWSDERIVPLTDEQSNYRMAMEAGLKEVNLIPAHIHPMPVHLPPQQAALAYEETLKQILEDRYLDLVMLGVGADGHTASLFPGSSAMEEKNHLVLSPWIESKKNFRLTLSLPAINSSRKTVIYAFGKEKADFLSHLFMTPRKYPCQWVGVKDNPALWILDQEAAYKLPAFRSPI